MNDQSCVLVGMKLISSFSVSDVAFCERFRMAVTEIPSENRTEQNATQLAFLFRVK